MLSEANVITRYQLKTIKEFRVSFIERVEKVNEDIKLMKEEIYSIHKVNTADSILKSSISEYQKRLPMLDATGLDLLFTEDAKVCQKNFDNIADTKLAKNTLDGISRDYAKFI